MKHITLKKLSLAAMCGATLGLAACGGGDSSPSSSSSLLTGPDGKSEEIPGPLDVVQEQVVTGLIGNQIGGVLPAPLGPTVQCAADAINSLVDGPDAVLVALTNLNGGDPAAAMSQAATQLVGSLQRFAAELQSTLMALANSGECSTVAGGTSNGNPLAGNPLAGTPLEPIGAALEPLISALGGFSGGGSDTDPNLTSVTDIVAPQLLMLSSAFNMVPDQAKNAPVLGGLLQTLQDATGDLAFALPAIGNYDAASTNAGITVLLDNVLSNVLLEVLPVRMIDEQTGQDFEGRIQPAINTLVSALGTGSSLLITPAFEQLLDGAASPVLDPVENLLDQILGNVGLVGADPTGNPLTALLGGIAGDGRSNPLDALVGMLTTGLSGNPLGSLTSALGGDADASQLDQIMNLTDGGLPLDGLLGQLANATAGIPVVGGLLTSILALLGG